MALSLSTSLRNARADEITTAVGSAGKVKIYDGTKPANVGTAVTTQTLLATLVWSGNIAGSASSGVLTLNAPNDDTSAVGGSTATWARITTSADAAVFDCTVTATSGGGDLELNDVSIGVGATVSITGGTLTEGDA